MRKISRPILFRVVLEVFGIVIALVLGLAISLAGTYWNLPKLANSSLIVFTLPVAWLLWIGFRRLVQKRWLPAIVRILTIPPVVIFGLFALAAGQIGGFFLASSDPLRSTLPLNAAAAQKLSAEGSLLAATLGTATGRIFTLDGIKYVQAGQEHTVEFRLTSQNGGFFSVSPTYRVTDSAWSLVETSTSGDTELVAELGSKATSSLPETLSADLDWPIDKATSERILAAGNELATRLVGLRFHGKSPHAWTLARLAFHESTKGPERVWLTFQDSTKAILHTDWRYTGDALEFDSVVTETSPEETAAARTIVGEALPLSEGFLRAKRSPPGTWRNIETVLGDGTVLTYSELPAHPFLAEYFMKVRIASPGADARTFDLPMNTGGRTAVFVSSGKLGDGTPALRVSSRNFDAVFTTSPPGWANNTEFQEDSEEGAFLGLKQPLAWFPHDSPEFSEAKNSPYR